MQAGRSRDRGDGEEDDFFKSLSVCVLKSRGTAEVKMKVGIKRTGRKGKYFMLEWVLVKKSARVLG